MSEEYGIPDHNNRLNAGSMEQAAAGVTTDTPQWQRDMLVVARRNSLGLDGYTGLPFAHTPSSSSGSFSGPKDKSQFGPIFLSLLKLLMCLCLIAGVIVGILYVAARRDDAAVRTDPLHGGTARKLAAELFPGEQMSPASVYVTKAELAVGLDEHEVLRSINTIHDLKPVVLWTNLTNPQLRHVMAVSYVCQVDPACRIRAQSVLNGPSDQRMMNYAAHFLERNARKGIESASKDLCDLTLLTGNTRAIAATAPEYCSLSVKANPNSPIARDHAAKLADSSNFRWLNILSWMDSL